jgi:Asp/Glu/hydantoin racemase
VTVAPWLGVLMLDTRFPRIAGDVGHRASWRMPVVYRTVRGATPQRVVRDADPALLALFIDAARALQAEGAAALTTSCGFLYRHQDALQAALDIPVWTSSLLWLRKLPHAGVITVDAASLVLGGTPVEGLAPGCALQRTLLDDLPTLDEAAAESETVAAAERLLARHPQVERIVLECTNLPPYAAAVERATGRPVHHLMTLVHRHWAHAAPQSRPR